jgi:hypothetical protein
MPLKHLHTDRYSLSVREGLGIAQMVLELLDEKGYLAVLVRRSPAEPS